MAEKAVSARSAIDLLKISTSVLLIILAVSGFYYFSGQMVVFRVLGMLFLAGLAAGIFYTTAPGRRVWQFLLDSRTEVRKMVWPTRTETTQVTLVIIALVIVVGLALWGLDLFLAWAIKMLMGYGG